MDPDGGVLRGVSAQTTTETRTVGEVGGKVSDREEVNGDVCRKWRKSR